MEWYVRLDKNNKQKRFHRCTKCNSFEDIRTTNVRRHIKSCTGTYKRASSKQKREKDGTPEKTDLSFVDKNLDGSKF